MGEGDWYQKVESKNVPAIRHEVLAERPPLGKNITLDNQVSNFLGSSITLPGTWKSSGNDRGTMKMTRFSAPGDSANLVLFERGMPVNVQSSRAFDKLISENANLTKPKELMPTEIKNLTQVLGSTTVGDNQYTNSAKPPDPRSPAFNLLSAHLMSLNGRTILEVQGNFVSATGVKGKEFKGIFVPSGENGERIKQFYLQADNATDAAIHQREYKQALQSIKW